MAVLVSEMDRLGVEAMANVGLLSEAVKEVAGGRVARGVDRSTLIEAMPPIVFRRGLMKRLPANRDPVAELVARADSLGLYGFGVSRPGAGSAAPIPPGRRQSLPPRRPRR